jgi:hypothetical protein
MTSSVTTFTSTSGIAITDSANSTLSTVQTAVLKALNVLQIRDRALSPQECKESLEGLLNASPALADIVDREPNSTDFAPALCDIIARAFDAYTNGDRCAIALSQSHLANDINGNDHYRITFRFMADNDSAEYATTLVEVRDIDGYNIEPCDSEEAHWLCVNDEPVNAEALTKAREIFEEAASGFMSGDFFFVSAPATADTKNAEATLERYAPLFQLLSTL